MVVLGHDRDRGQYRDTGLAHCDDMRAGADDFEKCDHMVDKIVKIEPAVPQRYVAGVVPVADVDIVLGQQCPGGAAQQGREMA